MKLPNMCQLNNLKQINSYHTLLKEVYFSKIINKKDKSLKIA